MPTPRHLHLALGDPETDTFGLIDRLCTHLTSPDYRGPPMLDVLRGTHDACPDSLSPIDQEAYTFLTLCQPPPDVPLRSVRFEDLDVTSAVDYFGDLLRAEVGESTESAAIVEYRPSPSPTAPLGVGRQRRARRCARRTHLEHGPMSPVGVEPTSMPSLPAH